MNDLSDRLDAIDRRYSEALDAKPGKGPITRFDAIVDSVADVPYLLNLARKQQAALDAVRTMAAKAAELCAFDDWPESGSMAEAAVADWGRAYLAAMDKALEAQP